jgi:hypothetical protein
MSRERSAGRLFRLHLGLGALAVVLLAALIASILAAIDLALPPAGSIAAACERWLSGGGPEALVVLFALGAALASLALFCRAVISS